MRCQAAHEAWQRIYCLSVRQLRPEFRVSAVVACAQVAMEVASLAQNATTTIYPWKDSQEHIDEGGGAREKVPAAACVGGAAVTACDC